MCGVALPLDRLSSMVQVKCVVVVDVVFVVFTWCVLSVLSDDTQDVFHNQFAVHVPAGLEAASAIASKYGFNNMGQV